MKKLLAWLLVFCMVLPMVPVTASAAETVASGTCGANVNWVLTDDGILTISGKGDMDNYEKYVYCKPDFKAAPWYENRESIRSVVVGTGVTSVGRYAFHDCKNLTSVKLANTVTGILYGAFTDCSKLTNVVIPDSVNEIIMYAFYGCSSLTHIEIPAGVIEIGWGAFGNCSSLASIHVDENNLYYFSDEYGVLYSKDKKSLIQAPGAYGGNYTVLDGVEEIQSSAFAGCTGLTGIILPDSLHYLSNEVFAGCVGLTEIRISKWVYSIFGDTFKDCSSLNTIIVDPDSVFYSADERSVLFDKEKTELIFTPAGLSGEYIIPDSVTEIWNLSFANRTKLESVVIPDGVDTIGYNLFEGCTGLKNIELPEKLKTIEAFAFSGCSALKHIVIPDSVTSIGEFAFNDCVSLESIDIPDGVTTIEKAVFQSCSGLKSVELSKNLTFIGQNAFYEGGLEKLTIPAGVEHIAQGAFYNCENLTELVMEGGVISLDIGAFGSCVNLQKLALPDSLRFIGEGAFHDCVSLTEVVIPANVATISDHAFGCCGGLNKMSFLGDAPMISGAAFDNSVFTACYPEGNTTWTAAMRQNYGGNITWMPYSTEEKNYVKWYSGTTSLNGTIDLNIYVLLSQDLVNDPDTFVRFTYDGNVVDVPMADAQHSPTAQNPNRYRFSCPIYAKQLADKVNAVFMKGSEQIGKALNYSVVQYCENQIKKVTDPQELALYKAMLNYGAAAQQMFSHNLENLANASLSDADKVLPDVDASAYKYAISGKEEGIRAKSATLMLEDVVKVRVYFALTGTKTIEDYTFTIDGQVVTPQYNDKGWYVETDGIAAKDLEHMFSIQVGGITVKYGALSYVNSMANGTKELEANISKALFVYWQAADCYLG